MKISTLYKENLLMYPMPFLMKGHRMTFHLFKPELRRNHSKKAFWKNSKSELNKLMMTLVITQPVMTYKSLLIMSTLSC